VTSSAARRGKLREQLTRLRPHRKPDAAEAQWGAVVGPSRFAHRPCRTRFPITDTPRYREIAEKVRHASPTSRASAGIATCTFAMPSREGRNPGEQPACVPWLPLFLALSANSAIYRNTDTWLRQLSQCVVWAPLCPNAGPPPHFDSIDEYDAAVRDCFHAGRAVVPRRRKWSLLGCSPFGPSSRRSEVRVADRACDSRRDRHCWPRCCGATVMTGLRRRTTPTKPISAGSRRTP